MVVRMVAVRILRVRIVMRVIVRAAGAVIMMKMHAPNINKKTALVNKRPPCRQGGLYYLESVSDQLLQEVLPVLQEPVPVLQEEWQQQRYRTPATTAPRIGAAQNSHS